MMICLFWVLWHPKVYCFLPHFTSHLLADVDSQHWHGAKDSPSLVTKNRLPGFQGSPVEGVKGLPLL